MIAPPPPIAVQAAPVGDAVPEEIVVTARAGRIALVFDRGEDGRLYNCRIFVSSGVDRIDDGACENLPDCVEDEAGHRFCGDDLLRPTAKHEEVAADRGVPITLPKLVLPEPEPIVDPAIGPVGAAGEDKDADRQLVDLPPVPKSVSSPTFRITGNVSNGDEQEQRTP